MKTEKVETKNGGIIDVSVYESFEDALEYLSEESVLKCVNRQIRTDAVNEANRKQSLLAKVRAAVKAGKLTQKDVDQKIEAILAGLE